MLTELPRAARERLRPLFADFPGLHGCIDAALEGTMGSVYADDAERPSFGHIKLDFDLLAGDPDCDAAKQAVARLGQPSSIVVSSPAWEPLLQNVWGDALQTRTRIAFRAGPWDQSRLREFMDAVPPEFVLKRITTEDAEQFARLADSLVYNFRTAREFAARGVGFGIEHKGNFVSGCSSFAISSQSLEFEIQTHPDFRRRGLATAAAAAIIEYCLHHHLEPCWDAHNETSAALAKKLGFVAPTTYKAHELPAASR